MSNDISQDSAGQSAGQDNGPTPSEQKETRDEKIHRLLKIISDEVSVLLSGVTRLALKETATDEMKEAVIRRIETIHIAANAVEMTVQGRDTSGFDSGFDGADLAKSRETRLGAIGRDEAKASVAGEVNGFDEALRKMPVVDPNAGLGAVDRDPEWNEPESNPESAEKKAEGGTGE